MKRGTAKSDKAAFAAGETGTLAVPSPAVTDNHSASSEAVPVGFRPAAGETSSAAVSSADEDTRAQAAAVKVRQSRTAKASFVWTVVSMLYAIGSGVLLVARNWVVAPYSYIMTGMLILYAAVFLVVVALSLGNVRNGRRRVSSLKKIFGIFRSFTLAMFLIATAVSMTGVIAAHGFGLWQWIVIGVHSAVAIVQVALKISLLVTTEVLRRIGKHYTVKVTSYVNGVAREKALQSRIVAKLYKTEITGAVSGGHKTDSLHISDAEDGVAADKEDGARESDCVGKAAVSAEEGAKRNGRNARSAKAAAGQNDRRAEKIKLDKKVIKAHVLRAVSDSAVAVDGFRNERSGEETASGNEVQTEDVISFCAEEEKRGGKKAVEAVKEAAVKVKSRIAVLPVGKTGIMRKRRSVEKVGENLPCGELFSAGNVFADGAAPQSREGGDGEIRGGSYSAVASVKKAGERLKARINGKTRSED